MNNINWDLAPEGAVELRELKSGVCLRWFNKQGEYFSGSGWELSTSDYNVIAIRPTQTKTVADAVEQEGEKWTHWCMREKCRIRHVIDGKAWVECERMKDMVVKESELYPIKPRISTKEYDLLAKFASSLNIDPTEFDQYVSETYASIRRASQ